MRKFTYLIIPIINLFSVGFFFFYFAVSYQWENIFNILFNIGTYFSLGILMGIVLVFLTKFIDFQLKKKYLTKKNISKIVSIALILAIGSLFLSGGNLFYYNCSPFDTQCILADIVESKNPRACEIHFEGSDRTKDQCYNRVTVNMNTEEGCNRINNDEDREKCKISFASNQGSEFCDTLNYNPHCYYPLFVKTKSEEICDQIESHPEIKTQCYYNLAIENLEEEYCMKTQDFFQKCVDTVLLLQKNLGFRETRDLLKSKYKEDPEIKLGFYERSNFGINGIYKVRNLGDNSLNSSSFKLFKDFKLEDADGCQEGGMILPNKEYTEIGKCTLEIFSSDLVGFYDIVYDGKTIFVD